MHASEADNAEREPRPVVIEDHRSMTGEDLVRRIEEVASHAWMVRTFVKHSEEAEEYDEPLEIARLVWDSARSLDQWRDDPPRFVKQLNKKIRLLREASRQLDAFVEEYMSHTNWLTAAASLRAAYAELDRLLVVAARAGMVKLNPAERPGGEGDSPDEAGD